MPIDAVFILAAAACGFGLSLATYRFFALRNNWAMGDWHRNRPGLPIAIGVVSVVWSVMIALGRGGPSLWTIPLFGVVGAAIWTSLLKVGSQMSLILAPIATVLLALAWIIIETPTATLRGGATRDTTVASDGARPAAEITAPASMKTKEGTR